MNPVLFLIPLLLVVSIPTAFAQVETTTGENYDLVEDFSTGVASWQSHPDRIMDGTWKNYVLSETEDKVIFNSNSIGSLVFDKNSCSYSIYDNGFVSAQTQIIPSVSAVATYNNGAWSNMDVNDSSCDVVISQNDDSVFLTSTKILNEDVTSFDSVNGTSITNTIQKEKFVQTINLDINGKIKETFYIYDDSNTGNQLGISQTVHVGETITLGDQEINIAELNGMSFDRNFIVDNEAEILQLTEKINYDFDKGIDSLSNVNIIHDSGFISNTYKVNIDYANGLDGVPFVGYLEIDPTISLNSNSGTNSGRAHSTSTSSGTTCSTNFLSSEPSHYIQRTHTGTSQGCQVVYYSFDTTSIPDGSSITSATLGYNVAVVYNSPPSVTWRELTASPPYVTYSTTDAQSTINDARSGTAITASDSGTSSTGSKTIALNSDGLTGIGNGLSSNTYSVGGYFTDHVRDGTERTVGFNSNGATTTLSVTYTLPPPPTAPQPPTGLTTTTGITLGTSWTAPTDNGGSALTGYKIYRTDSAFKQVELPNSSGSDSQITFTANELLIHGFPISDSSTNSVAVTITPATTTYPLVSEQSTSNDHIQFASGGTTPDTRLGNQIFSNHASIGQDISKVTIQLRDPWSSSVNYDIPLKIFDGSGNLIATSSNTPTMDDVTEGSWNTSDLTVHNIDYFFVPPVTMATDYIIAVEPQGGVIDSSSVTFRAQSSNVDGTQQMKSYRSGSWTTVNYSAWDGVMFMYGAGVTVGGTTSTTGTIGTALQNPNLSYADSNLPDNTDALSVGGFVKISEPTTTLSANTAKDATSSGTISTGVTGIAGNAWDFTGGKVTASYQFLPTSGDWTYSTWINLDTLSGGEEILRHESPAFEVWRNSGGLNVYGASGTINIEPAGNLATGTWYNIVLVHSSSGDVIYLNGVSKSTSDIASVPTGTSWYLGGRASTSETLNGQMDETAVWDRALTSSEVSSLYSSPATLPSGLLSYYNFEDTGTTLANYDVLTTEPNTKLLGLNDVTFSVSTTTASVVSAITPTLTNTYDDTSAWSKTGTTVTVDDGLAGKVYGNGNTPNGNDYVSKAIGTTLSDTTWTATMDLIIDSGLDYYSKPFLLVAGTGDAYTSNQDAIGFGFNGNQSNDAQVFFMWKDGSSSFSFTGSGINLVKGDQYYITVTRTLANSVTINVYTDEARTDEVTNSPQSYAMSSSIGGLTHVHHGMLPDSANDQAIFTIDNLKVYDGLTSASDTTILSATGLTDNTSTAQHYTFTRDGNDWEIYQNGASEATATDSTSLGSNTGVDYTTNISGSLDEFFINSDTLTSTEINNIYERGVAPTLIGSPTATSFDDSTATGLNYYSVRAQNAIGLSPYLTPFVSGQSGIAWNVPQNLSATISDADTTPLLINLSWDASTQGSGTGVLTGYEIFKNNISIGTVGLVTSTTHQLTAPGTNDFTIKSLSTHINSPTGNVASVTTPTAPGISTMTNAINNPNVTPLAITSALIPGTTGGSSITGFNLYFSDNNSNYISIANNTSSPYTHTASTPGTKYFKSEVVNNVGAGPMSAVYSITTPTVPSAITDLSGIVISDTQINLSWTAPSDGGSNIDLYKIFKDGVQVDTTTNLTYSLTGLSSNTAYAITVYANNSIGDSLVSNSVSVTTYQSVSGSITITKTTVGATSKLEFTSTSTGTPTPNFNSFTLKEGATILASGISTPYYLALNDGNPHTYTITSYDGTHWSTPTISGTVTETSAYSPNWNNNVSYNYTRASGVMDLTVNRDSQVLWDASCNYKTTAEVMNDELGITSNHTGVWNISESQSIADISTVYVSCTDGTDTLFSFTSFGPNRLGGGIAQLNDTFEGMIGTPVALIFVLLVAGLFTGRSAPTGILLVLALVGVLGFVGMLAIEEAIWGFLLLAGVLGIFLGKRFL